MKTQAESCTGWIFISFVSLATIAILMLSLFQTSEQRMRFERAYSSDKYTQYSAACAGRDHGCYAAAKQAALMQASKIQNGGQ